ncbi:MAG: phosphatase [Bacteroidota bacterium]
MVPKGNQLTLTESTLKFAAVDIGSNAVRLQVSSVLHAADKTKLKRVEYIRFPLRLGNDVFKRQIISAANEQRLLQLLQAFQLLIKLYEVDDYMVCATSAFRDAHNNQAISRRIQEDLGLSIRIIDGKEEAMLIEKAIKPLLLENSGCMHVDVGGGSTEVSFYTDEEQIASRSFDLGSVRVLEDPKATTAWEQMKSWIKEQKQRFVFPPIGVATGGNIRKLAQLAKRGIKKTLSLQKLMAIQAYVASFSLEERIHELELNPDRADVILPATQIYATAMQCGGIEEILVPDVSLRDGIIQVLYERNAAKPNAIPSTS